jgi:hypothetical protein
MSCHNPEHDLELVEDGECMECREELREAARKARYSAQITREIPKARAALEAMGIDLSRYASNTEMWRAWQTIMAAKRYDPDRRKAWREDYRARGLDGDQAFISATPSYLRFGLFARLTASASIAKAAAGRDISGDHIFPRNRLKGTPPALGLHVPANLQIITKQAQLQKKNNISRVEHLRGLRDGLGAPIEDFFTLPGDERLIYQAPKPAFLPDEGRRPYPRIDALSIVNVELPEDIEDGEVLLAWLLDRVQRGETFMGVAVEKMDAFQPEEGSYARGAPGSCPVLHVDEEGVDAMELLNAAAMIQPDNGSVIIAHSGPNEELRRLAPITLDGDGLTLSAYAVKALDEAADLYRRHGLEVPHGC